MKKIFLLLTMILVLSCVFLISASAEVVIYDDAPTKTNIQVKEDDIVVFDDGFTTLSAYVTQDNTHLAGWLNFFDFSYINSKTGKTYSSANVVEYDIPQGVISTNAYCMTRAAALKRVSIPDSVTSIGGCMFERTATLEECTFEHNENSGLKEIPTWMFGFCSNLKAISFPDCVEKITGNTQFAECNEMTAIYLPKNLKLTEGTSQTGATFGMLKKAYFVNEPFTYDNIPEKPTVYYFPKNYATMNGEVFDSCKNLNEVLVFTADNIGIDQYAFEAVATDGSNKRPTIVFLGDVRAINTKGWAVNAIYCANANDIDATSIGLTNNSSTIYYCNAQGNTNHLAEKTVDEEAKCEVDAGKVTYCFCGKEIAKEAIEGTALSHDYDYLNGNGKLMSITYLDLSMDGTKTVKCGLCGVDNDTIVAEKVFTYKGYSTNSKGAMCMGYFIDQTALNEYETLYGEVEYGFAASANNDTPLDENGDPEENTVKVSLNENAYTAVDFVLGATDWSDEKLCDVKITLNMYIIVNNAVKYITANGYSDTAEAYKYSEI